MIKKLHFLIWIGLSFINLKGNAQGCAALFNGVSTEAYVLTTPVSIHNFTVSLWFKAYGPGPLFSSSEDSSGLTGLGDKRIWIDGTGTLYCGVYSPGVNVINSNTMVLDSSCHHVAFIQSDTSIQLFIDGAYKGSSPNTSSDQITVPAIYWVVGHSYMIGDWQPQPPTYFFKGNIDELTIWNKRFSPTGVIDTLMQLNYPVRDTSFLWYFNFDNCSSNYTVSDARFADTLFYQNGVQPVASSCPASENIITEAATGNPLCAGNAFSVSYSSTGSFTAGNIFTVQLSDSDGNFGSPVNIGDSISATTSGSILAAIPAGTAPGGGYRVRVISSSPPLTGAPDTSAVVVNAVINATVSIATTSETICAGIPVTFTATAVNGGLPVYEWMKNGINVGINSNNYTDSSLLNGDLISCVMLSTASCVSPDTAVSNPLQMIVHTAYAGSISAIKDTLCEGEIVQLIVTGSTDSVLQWQSSVLPDGFADIAGADTDIYQALVTQNIDFRIVVNNGSCSDTSSAFPVIVNPAPAPPILSATDTIICSSDSAQITIAGNFTGYLWNTGDTTSFFEAKNAQGYWLTVTDANGCSAVSDHINIKVYPVSSVSIVVQGDTLASFNASSYQWLFDGNIIPGANTNIYVAPQTGDYSVQVTDTNGCREISNSTHISIAGITQFFESGQVNIYPNPTSSQIYISLRGINGPVELRILSIAGQEIRTQTVNTASNSTMLFDIAELPAGIYELMVLDQGRYNCYKLLKQ